MRDAVEIKTSPDSVSEGFMNPFSVCKSTQSGLMDSDRLIWCYPDFNPEPWNVSKKLFSILNPSKDYTLCDTRVTITGSFKN